MSTKLKRINMSIPLALYEQIQKFKQLHNISTDASACMQLIIPALNNKIIEQNDIRDILEKSK